MILERWPDLNFWTLSTLHISGLCRGPPWMALDMVQIVQDHPDGLHVAILCVIYDGQGTTDRAIIVRRSQTVFSILQILDCDRRCFAPQQFCVCRHNGVLVNIPAYIDIDDGDYFEVVIASTSTHVREEYVECEEDETVRSNGTSFTTTYSPTLFNTTQCIPKRVLSGLCERDTDEAHWSCTTTGDCGDHLDDTVTVFLQTNAVIYRWQGDTTYNLARLNPPGNGRVIDVRNGQLDKMDGIFQVGDTQILYDYDPPQKTATPIRLAAHLPSQAVLPDQPASIEIPDDVTSVLAAIRQGHVRSMTLFPLPNLPWHEATSLALHQASVSYIGHGLTHIELYTDGSAGQLYADYTYYDHAAWGFVVIGWEAHDNPTVLTMDNGHVTDQTSDPAWTGAARLNAMAGERGALIAAAVWLLRSQYQGHATFRFDSVAAGFSAAGQWNTTPGANDATLLRVLFQVLQSQKGLEVHFAHVKAHTGDPWNECANTLAHQAWSTHRINPTLDVDVRTVLNGDRPPCMHWPLLCGVKTGLDIDHGYLSWYRDSSEPRPEIVWQHLPTEQTKTTEQICIRLATFNVCTLQDRDGAGGLTAFMRAQFAHQKLDIIGLQETRASTTQVLRSQDYTRYIAAADMGGHGGTEIWITTRGPFAKALRPKNTVVLHQDSERLTLRLQVGAETFCVTAAHAPHSGHDKDYVRHWWTEFCASHQRLVGGQNCAILIDANAQFAIAAPPWIGACGLERKDNVCAMHLLDFLQQSQLFIPATFDQHHQGQTYTWRHPAYGTLHRCDYVLLPLSWDSLPISSWVDGCLDTGRQGVDHIAAVVEIDISFRIGGRVMEWPNVRIDRRALASADPAIIEKILQSLPQPGWAVNIHEQASTMVNELQRALQKNFPCQRKPPRADYISAEAWEIRARRRSVRRALYLASSDYAHQLVGRIFYIWKHYASGDHGLLQWHVARPVSHEGGLAQKIQLWNLGRQLKGQLAHDRSTRLGELADQAGSCPPSQVFAKLKSLGVCGKRKRRAITPLPLVGADSLEEHPQERWRKHFEELEDGVQIEPAMLLHECDRLQRARPTILPDFQELPTLLELEHAFRANSKGKACFFDGVPTELAHIFPQYLADYFFPLMVKQALLIAEPVTFKGGILVHAFKGKGDMGRCENYRSLMVSSIFAKSIHRVLRRQAVRHLDTYKVPGQLGGLPGKAVSQAAHILISWAHWQKQQKRSTAVIFVDVRQAFYRLLRAHLTSPARLDDDVARLFGTLKLPQESFQEFAHEIDTARALQQSGMSPYMEAHLEEVLQGTWFSLPSDCRLSKTRKGTRPGDNLADLLFSFVFARLLRRLMDTMEDEGLSFSVTGCCESHPFPWQLDIQDVATLNMFGPVWADDLAVMVSANSPAELLRDTKRTTALLFDQFALSGMDVNLGTSKTEIVITLRGAKAPAIRRELYRHEVPCLDIETRLIGTVHVRLVQTYRHLGTIFATNGRMTPEIRQKIGHAKAEFRLHRKKVYSQTKITSGRRVQLFKTLVLSGLLYNIAVWPQLTTQEHSNFTTGLMSLYASLAYSIWGTDTFSWRDEKVLSMLSIPSPDELLHMARLRYLQHIVLQGDHSIWTILHAEGQWLRMVEQDLEWMRSQIPWRVPQTDPRDEWFPWASLMRLGKPWKGLVAKAGLHAERQRKKHSDWYDWHRTLLTMLAEHDIWRDCTTMPREGFHACLKCRMRFATKAAWSVHAFKIHGRVTPARHFASGVECLVCLRRYGSHDRLVNHLRYSEKCRKEHRRRMLFATPQPSVNSAVVRQISAAGTMPVLPVQGPRTEPTEPMPYNFAEEMGPAEQDCVEDLENLFDEVGASDMDLDSAIVAVHNVFYRSWVYAPRLINIFCIAIDEHIQGELDSGTTEDQPEVRALRTLREGVYNVWSGTWLLSGLPRQQQQRKMGRGTLEPDREFTMLESSDIQTRVARPLRLRQVVFLHLFSGHRREGDLQQAIERIGTTIGQDIVALSVDIVISESYGNLLDPTILSLFVRAIAAGWVAGTAAGPPCETWSVARERYYAEGHGPRPLRDAFHLIGYDVLKLRELNQVNTGNQLLGVSVILLPQSWLIGAFFMLEHPVEPDNPTSAAIWRTPVLRFILTLPGIERHCFLQGLYGAASAKPTHLLFAHAPPSTVEIFKSCQTTTAVPKNMSIGRDDKGDFLTARLKVYPPGFCRAIAQCWWNHMLLRPRVKNAEQPSQQFLDAIQSMHHEIGQGQQSFGPDFNPRVAAATGQ